MDQLRLVAELISRLGGELTREPRSLLELEGLGRELWEGTDVDDSPPWLPATFRC